MPKKFPTSEAMVVTALAFFLAIMAWPMPATATEREAAAPSEAIVASTVGGKRLSRGFFDTFQIGGAPPTFWIYVEDSTIDGNGVEYYLYHSSYIEPGPANQSVTNSIEFNANAQVTSLNDAKAWIVNNHAHVNSVAELIVHKHEVSVP